MSIALHLHNSLLLETALGPLGLPVAFLSSRPSLRGREERHPITAYGETPNMAARVQGKAGPDEVVISAATQRLVAGLFETEDQGRHELKGITTPQPLYRVTAESAAQSCFEVTVQTGLTPLAGREYELGVLRER
jgi:hypothetical protein